MTAVKAGDVDRAVRSRAPGICVLLFYGPDSGRVAERARAAAEAAVVDPTDPFALVRLDGDDILADPGKLMDEATTCGLFGGRRVVLLRAPSRDISRPVAECLASAPDGTLIVIEAGALAKSSPLRGACERSPRALALPCYADEAQDLGAMVAESLRAEGLSIDREARDLLVQSLGGDRLASRGEIGKLVLYCQGADRVRIEDVLAVVSDVSSQTLDAALDAAFGGDVQELEPALRQLASDGVAAGTILSAALRHAFALLSGRILMDEGAGADAAMRTWRGLNFRRQDSVRGQLSRWDTDRLRLRVAQIQRATLDTRRSPALAEEFAHSLLLGMAMGTRRSGRR